MSNYLAVATVTETLAQIVRDAVVPVIPGAEVTTDRPDRAGKEAAGRVNLYLYQTAHNAALRNADLPVRDAAGLPAGRPRAALDLFYLVTFFGKDEQLVAQQLMALSVAALHANAVLTAGQVARAVQAAPGGFLDGSDLLEQSQPVTVAPMNLSLEELSKLWSVMFQVPYNLTVAYQCSVVLLDGAPPVPPALPTRGVNATASPGTAPVIVRVSGATGEPVAYGASARVEGSGLGGEGARVRIGAETVPPAAGASDTSLTVPLTGPSLRAGMAWLSVVRADGNASAPFPFTLSPAVSRAEWLPGTHGRGTTTRAGTVRVTLEPPVDATQSVSLFLNATATPPGSAVRPAYGFGRTVSGPGAPAATTLDFPAEGVLPGSYLVRVAVDGAQSPLHAGAAGTYAGPVLEVS